MPYSMDRRGRRGSAPAAVGVPSCRRPLAPTARPRRLSTMLRSVRFATLTALLAASLPSPTAHGAVSREQVEAAIKAGVRYLKEGQRADGSWVEADNQSRTGTTSLVTLALLTAGEPATSPEVTKALTYLRNF